MRQHGENSDGRLETSMIACLLEYLENMKGSMLAGTEGHGRSTGCLKPHNYSLIGLAAPEEVMSAVNCRIV